MTSATFYSGGTYNLATLGIVYNKSVTFSSLEIEVSELTQIIDGNPVYLDFTFYCFKPNTSQAIAFTPTLNGHGAETSTLAENKTFSVYTAAWNTDEVADFRISIDDSDAQAGTYSGTITFTFTT